MTTSPATDSGLGQATSVVEAPETVDPSEDTLFADLSEPAGPNTWAEWRDRTAAAFFGREVTDADVVHMLDVLWHWAWEQWRDGDPETSDAWKDSVFNLQWAVDDTRNRISPTLQV